MKAVGILLALGCTILARDTGWELMRCEQGTEVCYLHHALFPPEDKWALSCFYEPGVKNKMVIPPAPSDLKWHGR